MQAYEMTATAWVSAPVGLEPARASIGCEMSVRPLSNVEVDVRRLERTGSEVAYEVTLWATLRAADDEEAEVVAGQVAARLRELAAARAVQCEFQRAA